MKRFVVTVACLMFLASPVLANSTFSKFWKAEFAGADADEGFQKAVKTQGCYICHINGEDKKKVRNEYGEAIHKYLDAEDFPRDYVKENPEEAKAKILAGFKKAGEHKSKDGKTFAEKIKNNEIPATNSGKE
ncbi:MAG: hypothetical protein L7U72_01105 [Rubripirellula sp.]|nr:hypothetical protein [Rubripirellula sp.]